MLYVANRVGLPSSGIRDPDLEIAELLGEASRIDLWVDQLKHMILPALAIGIVLYGDYAIITRSALVETLGEDYVLTARAKGLSSGRIIRSHALRNAMLPITTLVALSLGTIVGGVLVVEYVFSYSGIGLAIVDRHRPARLPRAPGSVPPAHGRGRRRQPDRRPALSEDRPTGHDHMSATG